MDRRLARWEQLTSAPLTAAALLFLLAFAAPIVFYGSLDEGTLLACETVVWATWGLFVVDYAVRLGLAEDRVRYAARHWFDLVVIALPTLRPLRLLRLVTVLRVVNQRAATSMRGQIGLYAAGGASLLAIVGGLAVLDAERADPAATITDLGDALWWATTTMTTVGYGDLYPVTAMGRLVAVGLMVGGVGVLGTVSAMLASWLVSQVTAEEDVADRALLAEVQALRAEVAALAAGRGAERPAPAFLDAPQPQDNLTSTAVPDRAAPEVPTRAGAAAFAAGDGNHATPAIPDERQGNAAP